MLVAALVTVFILIGRFARGVEPFCARDDFRLSTTTAMIIRED